MVASCSSSPGSGGEPAERRADEDVADTLPQGAGDVRTIATRCVSPSGSLAVDASLGDRAGEYALTLVGSREGEDDETIRGRLSLQDQPDDLRSFAGGTGSPIPGVTTPLFGTADIRVEAVGALRVGDLSSADPAAPGVLVIESDTGGAPSILLRLGSDANRRGMSRFDGGFTVLDVREIGARGFKGTWRSGTRSSQAAGYFCVEPVGG